MNNEYLAKEIIVATVAEIATEAVVSALSVDHFSTSFTGNQMLVRAIGACIGIVVLSIGCF